jgi:hypothetical protein
MIKYVAFLRGINVGGHKLIKMTELAAIFSSLKLSNVKTYIVSGNAMLIGRKDPAKLQRRSRKRCRHRARSRCDPRTVAELEASLEQDPFKNAAETTKNTSPSSPKTKANETALLPPKGLRSSTSIRGRFVVAYPVKGRYGESMGPLKESARPTSAGNWRRRS